MTSVNSYSGRERGLAWSEVYPGLCLIMLATAPAIFLGEGNRNVVLIAFMFISPLFFRKLSVSPNILILLSFAFSIVLLPTLSNEDAIRWSTIFYSLMFCALFISYDSYLRSNKLRITTFLAVIRKLIIAYALVLLTQQICVLLNLPIPNLSNYDLNNRWKLNSLSAEPSHSARIVGLLMLCHIVGERLAMRLGTPMAITQKQTGLLWLCFLWVMTTMLSATALVMLCLVLLVYFRNFDLRFLLPTLVMIGVAMMVTPEELTSRALGTAQALLTLDYKQVLAADHSGGLRLAPMMILASKVEVFSAQGLFGNGIDSTSIALSNYIWGVEEGFTGGGLLSLWYEYGFISFALYVVFTFKTVGATKSLGNFLIWLMLIFLAPVNSQMTWLTICLMYSLNIFEMRAKLLERKML